MAKINGFPENTLKVFSGVITYDGSNPDTTNDTITFIMKSDKDDTDAEAVVDVDATGLGTGGVFTISITPALAIVTVGKYYYELIWHFSTGNLVLDNGIIIVSNKNQDNV